MKKSLIIGIVCVLVLAIGVFAFVGKTAVLEGCTLDAKVCSDGSTVGRTWPSCEFEACPELPYKTLDEYESSIDYSCQTDSDCAITDVRNCCGAYPRCTNKNFVSNPAFVEFACRNEGIGSVCGYPSIDGCSCVANACKGSYQGQALE